MASSGKRATPRADRHPKFAGPALDPVVSPVAEQEDADRAHRADEHVPQRGVVIAAHVVLDLDAEDQPPHRPEHDRQEQADRADGRRTPRYETTRVCVLLDACGIILSIRPVRRCRSLDDHHAVHDHPVAGEGAEVGIAAGLGRGPEGDDGLVLGLDDVGVGQDVVGPGDVVAGDGVGLGDDLVGQVADRARASRAGSGPSCAGRRRG